MQIIVKSKRCEVPARVKEEARSRVAHATRFYDRLTDLEIVFGAEANRRIAAPATVEVRGRERGRVIRAEAAAGDHRAAVDAAVARFERQLARLKTRRMDRQHGRARHGVVVRRDAAPFAAPAPRQAPTDGLIAQVVTVEAAPMLPRDAADELLRTGLECLVFTDVRNGRCGVMLRRGGGDVVLYDVLSPGRPGV